MEFNDPLIPGRLIGRYKRFFADVELDDGRQVTAHCANTGAMTGLATPGARVWLSPARNPKRKLRFTWELIEIDGALVGINTAHPNRIVAEAVEAAQIPEFTGYNNIRREVRYGVNSRIDILLEDRQGETSAPPYYVEVKNVHLKRTGPAEFPDAVTARGSKHLVELSEMVRQGNRAAMFYLVQRMDCDSFTIAADIDPRYAKNLEQALAEGVKILCYSCTITVDKITLDHPLPIIL